MNPIFSLARPVVVLLVAALVLTACQLLPFYADRDDARTQSPPASAPIEHGGKDPADRPALERAMLLLQDGEERAAEALLEEVLALRPEDAVARLLQAQIQRPPQELLGEEFTEIEVRPGDSLSAIAARHIGNELLFYALARLNGIDRPRLLHAGQSLLVPVVQEPEDVLAPDDEDEMPAAGESPPPTDSEPVAATVDRLRTRGRLEQAQGLLLSTARAGRLDDTTTAQLIDVSAALARDACDSGDPHRARSILDRVRPWIGTRAESGEFAGASAHVNARLALLEAREQAAAGDFAAALEGLERVRELDGSLGQAHDPELAALESALIEHFHGQALSAWRDQQVDSAVSLWRKVVEVDPGFEPARVYLDRALRLRRELESLEEG